MTRNEASIRHTLLHGIVCWCSAEPRNQLPWLRVLFPAVRIPGFGFLKAINLGDPNTKPDSDNIRFAFIGKHDRTYNPHNENCWTNQSKLPLWHLQRIFNKLLEQ